MNQLDEIRARLGEVDKHRKAYMNERDPETLSHCNSIIAVQDNAYKDERHMLGEIDRLTADRDYWNKQFTGLAEAHGNLTTDRNAWQQRAEAAEAIVARINAACINEHGYGVHETYGIHIDPPAQHHPCIACPKYRTPCADAELCEMKRRYMAAREGETK